MSRKTDDRQLSLLDWVPPIVSTGYDPRLIRGNSLGFRLSRAISVTLEECGQSRPEVAERMSDILGRAVTVNMLNAYASGQREDHQISVPRYDALIGATQDRRLLEFLAEPRGWTVVDRSILPLVDLAALAEHKKELLRMEKGLRRRIGGRYA
ncbi:hypothetical protein [Acetobacter persici]|uniref:DNA transposition protein n=1 Tax=Acetobacter persici TaxID=1076596 RepID=A0A6V8I7P5_9PROT|nr:hypothetical protein [Acetobacter persici]MBS1016951.1 hypothetical protein [Acetobacter persici]OUI89923.1 hypothetical protein HK19_13425 [Acetobacter persici]GFE93531.1 hypothetical protein DmAi_15900 [Acetobacter persici]